MGTSDPRRSARHNVERVNAAGGTVPLDLYYLRSLGPAVVPTLDRLGTVPPHQAHGMPRLREELVDALRRDGADWRSWTFRAHRVRRYLDDHPIAPARPIVGDAAPR